MLRARWLQLFWELALAFGIGIPVAGILILYYSRRIARPLEELASAADEVAAGHYDVAVPERTWGSEVERLSTRFHEMTTRLSESEQLSRNFLMSVSHELRTPLTAIRGHVSALREGIFEDEASQSRSLEVVSEEAMRLERLVGDVLDLAKLDARRFALLREEVDMRALCERAYATFAEEARARGIEYDLELGEGAVLITDGDRVLQIVTNLLANALHWTPEGGRVDLALGTANGEVRVAVSDTGPGVEPGAGGADLPAVLVGRRRRHRPRPHDRARTRHRTRRPARAAQRAWPGQPLRARAYRCVYFSRRLTLVEAVDDGAVARQSLLELRQALFDAPPT